MIVRNRFVGQFIHDDPLLSLNQLSDLFGRDKSFLSKHLRNIYDSCELGRKTTVAFFATVQKKGGHQIEHVGGEPEKPEGVDELHRSVRQR